MCCANASFRKLGLFTKAMMDTQFRETFLADPMAVAREFGLSQGELDELAQYDPKRLRAVVEGPNSGAGLGAASMS